MSKGYRLAVIETADSATVMVEHGGRLLPIERLLASLPKAGSGPVDLMPVLADWPRVHAELADAVSGAAERFRAEGVPAEGARFRSPIAMPGKIVCIGSNYHDHIAEMAIPMTPTYPYSFLKPANNTVRGSGDPVAVPAKAAMMDWEAELGVVIGVECREVPADRALDVVAGYLNFNDLSARDWLASRPPVGIDWVQHKAFDGFAPMGPYLVPAAYVEDPQNLPVRLRLNGEIMQDSSTAEMVFGVAAIIEHLSSIMTLCPGDVIATGTPAGTGHGARPPRYLRSGDEVRVEIGALGELVTPIA